jgi:glycosyltransferase involved in cell wall biosynthesis
MAAGVPVVATRVGGIPEMVTDNESALLVKPGAVSAMTDAIARLLEDSQLAARLIARSRELIRDRHAPDARMRRLVSIYRKCKPAL